MVVALGEAVGEHLLHGPWPLPLAVLALSLDSVLAFNLCPVLVLQHCGRGVATCLETPNALVDFKLVRGRHGFFWRLRQSPVRYETSKSSRRDTRLVPDNGFERIQRAWNFQR